MAYHDKEHAEFFGLYRDEITLNRRHVTGSNMYKTLHARLFCETLPFLPLNLLTYHQLIGQRHDCCDYLCFKFCHRHGDERTNGKSIV